MIRSRINPRAFDNAEDANGLRPMTPLLELLMITGVNVYETKDHVERLRRIEHNNAENEPSLILVAFAWGYLTNGNPAPYAVNLLWACVIGRVIHNIAFVGEFHSILCCLEVHKSTVHAS